MAEVVKIEDGKATMFAMRSVEPGAALFPPPSRECKVWRADSTDGAR